MDRFPAWRDREWGVGAEPPVEVKTRRGREAVAIARAEERLAAMKAIGAVTGWSRMGHNPVKMLVSVAEGEESLQLTCAEVKLFEAGVNAGIEAMRKAGLL